MNGTSLIHISSHLTILWQQNPPSVSVLSVLPFPCVLTLILFRASLDKMLILYLKQILKRKKTPVYSVYECQFGKLACCYFKTGQLRDCKKTVAFTFDNPGLNICLCGRMLQEEEIHIFLNMWSIPYIQQITSCSNIKEENNIHFNVHSPNHT